jgi:Icc protein
MPDILLRFVHISDTHYCSPDYERPPSRANPRAGTHRLVEQVNALPFVPDLILHTGDVAYDPYPDIYDEIKSVLAALKAPVIYIPGNHDHSGALQTVLMGRDTVKVPFYEAQTINGVRFICLDTNHPQVDPPAGRVSDEQLVWLREQIAQDDPRPIVVAVHHPLLKTHTSEWYDVFMMTENGDAVHEALLPAADRLRGVYFGHVHHSISFHRDGILYSAVNSSWTQFDVVPGQGMDTLNDLDADPSFNVVTITTDGLYIQRQHYRLDEGGKLSQR